MLPPMQVQIHTQHIADDLVGLLRQRVQIQPDTPAFIYLKGGQSDPSVSSYYQLEQRACAIAARLQEMDLVGKRVLLAYPQGMEFIAGLFGCLYAGCVAVPTNLPHRRTLDRFAMIANDARAELVLSSSDAMASLGYEQNPKALILPWLASDEIPDIKADHWQRPQITPDSLAILQYTSGSTSQPKGVMLSHGSMLQNTQDILNAFEVNGDAGVFWLPTFHDMGLVGGVLVPVLAGLTNVLMAPGTFLKDPITWLSAITQYGANVSGGPNFAYDLCARKITEEQRQSLDLSCWDVAFVGAEPVSAETLERFARTFEPCGFRYESFFPCYGMAEATLMITGSKRGKGPVIRSFHETALAQHQVEPVTDPQINARRLVGCGMPVGDHRVHIVDPHTCMKSAPGHAGEIWVTGTSLGKGYWQKTELTHQKFGAILSDTGQGPFLRTGDMGFIHEGQLYILGRLDDMLIVRGQNHHPQDLEATAHSSHTLLESGLGAVFAVENAHGSQLILVHEATFIKDTDFEPVFDAVNQSILQVHGLSLQHIVLVRHGTIPRTSSGKIQRRNCRDLYLNKQLKVIAQRTLTTPNNTEVPKQTNTSTQNNVLAAICEHAETMCGLALSNITPDTKLSALGLDSLQYMQFAATLEKNFACRLSNSQLHPEQTIDQLAQTIVQHLDEHPRHFDRSGEIPPEHYAFESFPEYRQLKRYEHILKTVTGDNPYEHIDQGGSSSPANIRIQNHELVNFCAYDYVGMAHDPVVTAAAKAAIDHYGTSAGASRLVSGEKQIHRQLEQELAHFLGTDAAIVFVSGHATNVTTIGHLLSAEDLVVHDVLAHNSIIQGAQLSGATRRVFAHNDFQAADALLSEVRHRFRRVLIAIEGVYSMDGDFPDLLKFIELKKKHKTLLLVDEAHSLGTMGQTGRGIGELFNVDRADVDLWMGTLSKSLASCGGYIAGSTHVVDYLRYSAPGFVYSVGLSPSNAAAAKAALSQLQANPQCVAQLAQRSKLFLDLAKNHGLDTGLSNGTPVIPVIVGNSVKSLRLAKALFERGINVQPILHPAVPEHAARLRFFITTNHSPQQIQNTVDIIAREMAKL